MHHLAVNPKKCPYFPKVFPSVVLFPVDMECNFSSSRASRLLPRRFAFVETSAVKGYDELRRPFFAPRMTKAKCVKGNFYFQDTLQMCTLWRYRIVIRTVRNVRYEDGIKSRTRRSRSFQWRFSRSTSGGIFNNGDIPSEKLGFFDPVGAKKSLCCSGCARLLDVARGIDVLVPFAGNANQGR